MTVPCSYSVDSVVEALAAAGLAVSPDLPLTTALSVVFRADWFGGGLDVPEPPPVRASGAGALLPYTVTAGPGGVPCAWPAVLVWRERGGYRVRKFFPGVPPALSYVRGSRARFATLVEALAWAVEV